MPPAGDEPAAAVIVWPWPWPSPRGASVQPPSTSKTAGSQLLLIITVLIAFFQRLAHSLRLGSPGSRSPEIGPNRDLESLPCRCECTTHAIVSGSRMPRAAPPKRPSKYLPTRAPLHSCAKPHVEVTSALAIIRAMLRGLVLVPFGLAAGAAQRNPAAAARPAFFLGDP